MVNLAAPSQTTAIFLCFLLPPVEDGFRGRQPLPRSLRREVSEGSGVAACIARIWSGENVWGCVGGECTTGPPVADHCSCHVVTDCEHSSARTALATFGQRPKMTDTGTSG